MTYSQIMVNSHKLFPFFIRERENIIHYILSIWDFVAYEGKVDQGSPETVTFSEAMEMFYSCCFFILPIPLPHMPLTLSLNTHHVSHSCLILASASYQLLSTI